jgi:hypothetical protein
MLPIGVQFANIAPDGLKLTHCYYNSLPTWPFSFLEIFSMQTINELKKNESFISVLKDDT